MIRTRRKWQLVNQTANRCDIYQFETDSVYPKLVLFKHWVRGEKDPVSVYDINLETAREYWDYVTARGAILTVEEETKEETND